MEEHSTVKNADALSKITNDRLRTNILKAQEQKLVVYLVQRIPSWIHSDMLTTMGLVGSMCTTTAFILAFYLHRNFLMLGIVGFAVNWFGDSLDGRLAYFRNTPRKWYGFSLDITVDWISTILIGIGYMVYVSEYWYLLGFCFVAMYGLAMIIALMRYQITNQYIIDSALFGPTEVRVLISLFLLLEIFVKGSILFSGGFACLVLLITNAVDFARLLKMADVRDKNERVLKQT